MDKRKKLQNIILYGTLIAGSFIMLIPLAWMILTSLKTFPEVVQEPPVLIPKDFQWGNYKSALTEFHFTRFLMNSMIITFFSVIGTVVSTTMAAYAFACLNFKYKNIIFGILLSSMMLPGQVTVIPVFMLFTKFGWINTYWPLILPHWLATSVFSIFLIRQFFLTIPMDFVEAARLDGATEFQILWMIYVPLSKPVLLTVTVFSFLGSWNDLWGPLIYLHKEELYTIPIGILNFIASAGQSQAAGTPWHLVMAVSFLIIIPVVIIFFLAQKRFIEGIASTGLKG